MNTTNRYSFRISSPVVEGTLALSKRMKVAVLLDPAELKDLFTKLGTEHPFQMYYTQGICGEGEEIVAQDTFFSLYASYFSFLQTGKGEDLSALRREMSLALSTTPEIFYAFVMKGGKRLIKPLEPIIQLQAHTVGYSPEESVFRSMVFGEQMWDWGLLFSYPQLYQEPLTQEIKKSSEAVNALLFRHLQRWMRAHTLPVFFQIQGKRIPTSFRLGKKCFSWIADYLPLKERGLQLYAS